MPPQLTYESMIQKVIAFGTMVGLMLLYFLFRVFVGRMRYLGSGQIDEQNMLKSKQITIQDLQAVPWTSNTGMAITFSSFGLNVIILAIVFIFEQRLTGYDAVMFDILLAISAVSVLAYFMSVQLWLLALDIGGSEPYRLRFRRLATALQSIGLITLLAAGLFGILIIDTTLGYIFNFLAVCCFIFISEFKAHCSIEEEARNSDLNEFQKNIPLEKIQLKDHLTSPPPPVAPDTSIRVLTWNIERGYHPAEIAAYIKQFNADIICLQEVDWNNLRTGSRDILDELAREMGMIGLFSLEFYEIQTPLRRRSTAGGGVHGNAILTRFQPLNSYRIEMPELYDWVHNRPHSLVSDPTEKRKGSRHGLLVEFEINSQRLLVATTHLEDKAGGLKGRFAQYSALTTAIEEKYGSEVPAIICGDFNTFDNRLTRAIGLSRDEQSLGKPPRVSECQWWKEQLLPPLGYSDPFSCKQWTIRHGPIKFKLDWITARGCEFMDYGVGAQKISDHNLLWSDIRIKAI